MSIALQYTCPHAYESVGYVILVQSAALQKLCMYYPDVVRMESWKKEIIILQIDCILDIYIREIAYYFGDFLPISRFPCAGFWFGDLDSAQYM